MHAQSFHLSFFFQLGIGVLGILNMRLYLMQYGGMDIVHDGHQCKILLVIIFRIVVKSPLGVRCLCPDSSRHSLFSWGPPFVLNV